MPMILNDIWNDFCRNIQASNNADVDKKIAAINLGQKYLLDRCIELLSEDVIPKDFLSNPTNVANDAASNKMDLPSDFKKLFAVWVKNSSSRYRRLEGSTIVTYDMFLTRVGENFYDTSFTGEINYVAVAEPYLYIDKYITASGTDNLKLQYYQTPADIVAYERLNITGASGAFQAEETVSGGTSNATAKVYAVAADNSYIDVYTKDYNAFTAGETITGSISTETATFSSVTNKPASLKLTSKYKNHLIEAAGLQYHVIKGSDEIEGRSLSVDNWIMNIKAINQNKVGMRWGFGSNVY